ncbi:MAG: UDP-3-O-(3-hydroxymyristoyl)glucosamine N-acyltransferase [Planctomycetaceae bacterium]|jgi:UDP-3-O-[3-hydroxymyristoyl] glucosamine N-acyltransferase
MTVHTLKDLAALVKGRVLGDADRDIRDASPLTRAGANEITFAADDKNFKRLRKSSAGACLVPESQAETLAAALTTEGLTTSLVAVADPLDAFLVILREFRPLPAPPRVGVSPQAHIDPSATVGTDTQIYPGAVIDARARVGARCLLYPGVYIGPDCTVGDDCVLYPHVVLYYGVTVGSRVILHAGVVLGADGFGYRFRNGRFDKIPQLGSVRVEDDVEIGANTTVDRGMIGPTVVGAGTKLDNLVMIGHNCEIGRHNVFASQVGMAGSCSTGDYVRLGGQVGTADHVHLGQGATVGAKAGVHRDIPAGETHVGIPARPEMEELKIVMATARTPEMRKQIRDLEKRLEELEKRLSAAPGG